MVHATLRLNELSWIIIIVPITEIHTYYRLAVPVDNNVCNNDGIVTNNNKVKRIRTVRVSSDVVAGNGIALSVGERNVQ